MPNYNFETLSAYEFETLVRDLLQAELGIVLESFKAGRDQGIDLRYARAKDKSLIVQCKHYIATGTTRLIADLKTHEAPKVRKLSPQRYIVATSVGLSPANKDAISCLFPSCASPADIYGKDDLNNLLGRHQDIETSHYKLWLTSVHVLENLIKSTTKNRTRLDLERIHRNVKFYVQNAGFEKAKSILDEQHYCIITGIPGIGKTTLAEALYLDHVSRGFEPVRIYRSIEEGFELYKIGVRQVFYFDDFLGTTAFDEADFERNEDKQLLAFLQSVHASAGEKKFILTSRDYILKQARLSLESVRATDLKPHLCIVNLHNYTRFNKAEILYNHLYFSHVSRKHIGDILRNQQYFAIIDHPNYSPRVIEWMTQMRNRWPQEKRDYAVAFIGALDNPVELWRTAFERNLSVSAKYMLWVLVSLPDRVTVDTLKTSYVAFERYMAELKMHAMTDTNFTDVLEEIEGTFIEIEIPSATVRVVRFHNPSVRDFLEAHLSDYEDVIRMLTRSAQLFSQLRWLWGEYRISLNHSRQPKQLRPRYRKHLIEAPDDFVTALTRTLQSEDHSPELAEIARRGPVRLTSRLLLLIDVNKTLDDSRLDDAIADTVQALKLRARQGSESSFELMRLAKELQLSPQFSDVKDSFLHSLKSLVDFQRYLIFKFRYGEELTAGDVAFVESRFRELFPGRKLLDVEDLDDDFVDDEDEDDEDEDEDGEDDEDDFDRKYDEWERDVSAEQRAQEWERGNPNRAIIELFDGLGR